MANNYPVDYSLEIMCEPIIVFLTENYATIEIRIFLVLMIRDNREIIAPKIIAKCCYHKTVFSSSQ